MSYQSLFIQRRLYWQPAAEKVPQNCGANQVHPSFSAIMPSTTPCKYSPHKMISYEMTAVDARKIARDRWNWCARAQGGAAGTASARSATCIITVTDAAQAAAYVVSPSPCLGLFRSPRKRRCAVSCASGKPKTPNHKPCTQNHKPGLVLGLMVDNIYSTASLSD
jgi:hypothetical protein